MTEMLAYVLSLDTRLKAEFLRTALPELVNVKGLGKAKIETQVSRLINTDDAEVQLYGIPDMAVTGGGFTVLVENKLGAGVGAARDEDDVTGNQVTKYLKILADDPSGDDVRRLVLIDFNDPGDESWFKTETWKYPDLYKMFAFLSWHDVSDFFYDYALRRKLDEPVKTVLKQFNDFLYEEKGMGTFRGIPEFDEENPFTDRKARDVFILFLAAFNEYLSGYTYHGLKFKIADKPMTGVWHPIVVEKDRKKRKDHTREPHITLCFSGERFDIRLTLPNNAIKYWNVLEKLVRDRMGFVNLINRVRETVPELWFGIYQQHAYAGQNMVSDATAEFKIDLLPGINRDFESSAFKQTEVWWTILGKANELRKQSNGELAFIVRFYLKPFEERKNRERVFKSKGHPERMYKADVPGFTGEVFKSFKALMPLFRAIYTGTTN